MWSKTAFILVLELSYNGEIEFHYATYIKQAMKTYFYKSARTRWSNAIAALVALFCLGVGIMAVAVELYVLSAVVLLTVLLNYWIVVIYMSRKFLKDARYNKEFTLRFDEDEMELSSEDLSSRLKLSYFINVWENHDFFLLFHTKRHFWFVPKAAFGPGQEEKFCSCILKHQPIKTGTIR